MKVPRYEGDINEHLPMPEGFRNRDLSGERLDLILEDRNSPELVISFGGCGLDPDTNEAQYAMQSSFGETSISHLLLRDHFQVWYFNGIRGLSKDIRTTVEGLRGYIAEINPSRVITTGVSGGGFAAILFGIILKVDRIAAVNPQSLLRRNIECFAHGNLYRLKWTNPLETPYRDLLNLRVPKQTKLVVAYGQDDPVDSFHSGRLEALDDVEFMRLDGNHHSVGPQLRDSGQLIDLVLGSK